MLKYKHVCICGNFIWNVIDINASFNQCCRRKNRIKNETKVYPTNCQYIIKKEQQTNDDDDFVVSLLVWSITVVATDVAATNNRCLLAINFLKQHFIHLKLTYCYICV